MRRLIFVAAFLCATGCTAVPQNILDNCNSLLSGASPDAVIRDCSAAIKTQNGLDSLNTAGALTNRGAAYLIKGQFESALADLTAAIAIVPELKAAHANLAIVYYAKGNTEQAFNEVDRAIALDPSDANALSTRCFLRAATGTLLNEALADCDKSLAIRPNAATALDSRAFVLFKQSHYQDAIGTYDAALKLSPKYSSSLYMRGISRQRIGDTQGGKIDIKAATDIDSNIDAFYARFGVTP